MLLTEYQEQAARTAQYPKELGIVYPALGLGEIGEIANQVKKVYRDDGGRFTEERIKNLRKECGDLLWYIATTATEMGVPIDHHFDNPNFTIQGRLTFDQLRTLAAGVSLQVGQKRADHLTLRMMKLVGRIADEAEYYRTLSKEAIVRDLGGLLIALDLFAFQYLGTTLEQVAQSNLDKLADRANRGVIQGSGDNR